MNRIPFRNHSDRTIFVRPAKDHLLTSESPFLGCVEISPQTVAWLWLEVRFESAVARLDLDGEVLVETTVASAEE